MIHSVALIIADFLFSKDAITEEEKEVCVVLCQDLVQVKMRNFFPF